MREFMEALQQWKWSLRVQRWHRRAGELFYADFEHDMGVEEFMKIFKKLTSERP